MGKRETYVVDEAIIAGNTDGKKGGAELYDFAVVLNRLMDEKGIDQDKLANDLQISTGAVSNYRNGKAEPRLATIRKIAQYFDVDCHYLMTGVKAENASLAVQTGLSDGVIDTLIQFAQLENEPIHNFYPHRVINRLFSHGGFYVVMENIGRFWKNGTAILKKIADAKKETPKCSPSELRDMVWPEYERLRLLRADMKESLSKVIDDVIGYEDVSHSVVHLNDRNAEEMQDGEHQTD